MTFNDSDFLVTCDLLNHLSWLFWSLWINQITWYWSEPWLISRRWLFFYTYEGGAKGVLWKISFDDISTQSMSPMQAFQSTKSVLNGVENDQFILAKIDLGRGNTGEKLSTMWMKHHTWARKNVKMNVKMNGQERQIMHAWTILVYFCWFRHRVLFSHPCWKVSQIWHQMGGKFWSGWLGGMPFSPFQLFS